MKWGQVYAVAALVCLMICALIGCVGEMPFVFGNAAVGGNKAPGMVNGPAVTAAAAAAAADASVAPKGIMAKVASWLTGAASSLTGNAVSWLSMIFVMLAQAGGTVYLWFHHRQTCHRTKK